MVKMYSTKFHKGLLESAPKHSLGCRQLRRPKWELKIGEEAVQLLNRGSVWRQLKRATVRFKRGHKGLKEASTPPPVGTFQEMRTEKVQRFSGRHCPGLVPVPFAMLVPACPDRSGECRHPVRPR